MNLLKRATIYLKRNLSYSITLSVMIFLLSALSLGALSAYRLIQSVEDNLWSNLPAIITIEEEILRWFHRDLPDDMHPDVPMVTQELIEEIAQLSYVEDAVFASKHHLRSRTLDRYWIPIEGYENILTDLVTYRDIGIYDVEGFQVRGVTRPDMLELTSGIIEIIDGTTFTEEQIKNGEPVALISRELAILNNLSIGSVIALEELVIGANPELGWFDDGNIFDSMIVEFEIIGIYQLTAELNAYAPETGQIHAIGSEFFHITQTMRMLNLIYIPHRVLNEMRTFGNETAAQYFEDGISYWLESENFIILNDSRDLPVFHEAVAEILPEFIIARDVSASFPDLIVGMSDIRQVSVLMLVFLIGGSILVLGLLVLLLLHNRKNEIGIYLALGENRNKIMSQFIIELLIISIIAITTATLTNHIISRQIATHFVTQELANMSIVDPTHAIITEEGITDRTDHLIDWLRPAASEVEELIEIFDISMRPTDVILFYGTSITIVMISTLTSMVYMMRLKPKDILVDN